MNVRFIRGLYAESNNEISFVKNKALNMKRCEKKKILLFIPYSEFFILNNISQRNDNFYIPNVNVNGSKSISQLSLDPSR